MRFYALLGGMAMSRTGHRSDEVMQEVSDNNDENVIDNNENGNDNDDDRKNNALWPCQGFPHHTGSSPSVMLECHSLLSHRKCPRAINTETSA